MTDDRPSGRPRTRGTAESPLVWGLLVAIMLIAFVNFLFVAVAAPSAYRVVLAIAAGGFLVVSMVQFGRSSRERARRRGESAGAPGAQAEAESDGHRPDEPGHPERDGAPTD